MGDARRQHTRLPPHKLFIRIGFGLVATIVTWILVGLPLFVFPHTDEPRKVDAIIVLGPSKYGMEYAENLMDQGLSGNLVISSSREDGEYVSEACSARRPYAVTCFAPDPGTTQGEARAIAGLALENGWTEVAVVTIVTHVNRARLIIGRCYTGTLNVYAYARHLSLGYWVQQYVYQTGAFVKALGWTSC
ncbi:YdcF family protein [Okibacterium endophyticum]